MNKWILLFFILTCGKVLAQEDPLDNSVLNNTDFQVNDIHEINHYSNFNFSKFDWIEWNSLGIFPEIVLVAIKERVHKLGGFSHWLELQSISGLDTSLLAQLLSKYPQLLNSTASPIYRTSEVRFQLLNRINFPDLNRYAALDSSKIPEGSPWAHRVRFHWNNENTLIRIALEKDQGEPTFPMDHLSWCLQKSWQLQGWQVQAIAGQFRPFFGIGYRFGLRSGRSASIIGTWSEAHDLQLKPLASATENLHPQGIALQFKKGNWTIAGFYSDRRFPLTDSQRIDGITEMVWLRKPKLPGLHRTETERNESYSREQWGMINALYAHKTWAIGFGLNHENWTPFNGELDKWSTYSAYFRKSYSGGHFQSELMANSLLHSGYKLDWIHWFGSQGTIQVKAQHQLNSPEKNQIASLVQWRTLQVNEQYIQLYQNWKLGRRETFYQQFWRAWTQPTEPVLFGWGVGIQWNASKTDQLNTEIRFQNDHSTILVKANWMITLQSRFKTTFRLIPATASLIGQLNWLWNPKSYPLKLYLQMASFQIKRGVLPMMEADLDYPFRMLMMSGTGGRFAFQGKMKLPPYFYLGLSGAITQKIGETPFGEGLDGRPGNQLIEIGFHIEIRLKDNF